MAKLCSGWVGSILSSICIGCTPVISVLAQTSLTGSVSGWVYDVESPSRAGLVGATLILTNQETSIRRSTMTRKAGNFSFDMLAPGRYVLACTLKGYENVDQVQPIIEVYIATLRELKVPPFAMRKRSEPRRTETSLSRAPRWGLDNDGLWEGVSTAVVVKRIKNTGSSSFLRSSLSNVYPKEGEQHDWLPLQAPPDNSTQQFPSPPSTPAPVATPKVSVPIESSAVKLVNTASATRGGVFTELQILSLPLPGIRSYDALAFLLPGVSPPPVTLSNTVGPGIGSSVGTAGQFSVNGLRSRGNNFTVDGSDNNDEDIGVRRQGFTSQVPQSIESVNQLQISTLLAEPQFGRNVGGKANVVSRYGGEQMHGSVYGFLSDKRFNARDFFDYSAPRNAGSYPVTTSDGVQVELDGDPLTTPNPVGGENPFTRLQYGFALGMPITKEQKAFVFASLERQQINSGRESHFAVPTVDARGLNQSGGKGLGTIYDPVYPTSEIGEAFFSLFPFPNNPLGPYGKNTYTEILPASARGTVLSFKLDMNVWQKHYLTSRFNLTDDDTILSVTGGALFSSLRPRVRTQNLSLFSSSALSTTLSNEARFSFGRTNLNFDEVRNPRLLPSRRFPSEPFLLNAPFILNETTPGSNPKYVTRDRNGNPLGDIESAPLIPVGQELYPIGPLGQVIVSGYSPIGVDVFNFPQARVNNTFQYADTLIYYNGKNRITGGFDARRSQLNSDLERNFRPLAVFSGARNLSLDLLSDDERNAINQALGTSFLDQPILHGSDFVSVGSPSGFYQTQALVRDANIGLRYWQNSFFLLDQIQTVPKLTLSIGLHFEHDTVPSEVNERIERSFQDPEVQKLPPLVGFLDGRTQIYRKDGNNFAPYVAAAWDPFGSGKTSIRAGYGIYFDQILGAVVSQSRNVFPNFVTLNFAGLGLNGEIGKGALQLSNTLGFINPVDMAVPQTLNTYYSGKLGSPADLINSLNDVFSGLSAGAAGAAFTLPAADLKTPYAQHWGVTFEREFTTSYLVSAAYVGTRGLHLLRIATPNLGPSAIPLVRTVEVKAFQPVFHGNNIAPGFDSVSMLGGRPEPVLGSFTSIESDASSVYHSLQIQLNKRFSQGLQFTAAYTWSHAIDEVSDLFNLAGARSIIQNRLDRRAERADANFDVRHRFVYSAIWDLPVFKENRGLGGWRIASTGSFQTGQPYSKYSCCDLNSDGNLADRIIADQGIDNQDAPRNLFRTPAVASVDLALIKRFQLSKFHSIDLRSEFFNLFNRTHFGVPVNEEEFPAFGKSVNTRVPARTIQFALKYNF